MPRFGSAKRHAQAVFRIAQERGELEAWPAELKRLAQGVEKPGLRMLLEDPRLSLKQKMGLLEEELKVVNPLVLNLASLLVSRGRLGLAQGIAEEYGRLLLAHQGIEPVEVVSAVPLDEVEKERIAQKLSAILGKRVLVKPRVDPGIIGGLIARTEEVLINGSTRARLEALRKNLITVKG